MKEKLFLPTNATGNLWLYNKERFLELSYQSFMHRHDELELNLVTHGRGIYLMNSRKYELASGSTIWLFPEQDHLLLQKTLDFEMWILVVKPEYLRAICTDSDHQVLLEGNPEGNFFRSLPANQVQKLSGLCRETVGLRADQALFNTSMGYILLMAWAACQAASHAPLEKSIHPAVDRVAKLVMDGRGSGDLQDLALEVGLSPTSLSRIFKKQMGVSLTTFRNRCRVEKFLDLYGDGQSRNMLSAALEAGFGSYAQFFRVFRQIMGGNPGDYRQKFSRVV